VCVCVGAFMCCVCCFSLCVMRLMCIFFVSVCVDCEVCGYVCVRA